MKWGVNMNLSLDLVQTIAIAVLVLLLGKQLVKRIHFLEKYSIPAPVVGGFIFAILALGLRQGNILSFEFDTTLQDVAMTVFFTSVGFSASFGVLKKGGIKLILFLVATVTLVVLQNVLGVSLATLLDLDPLLGLATGSVPMTGGHATAGAFGPEIVEAGVVGADTVALAAATFGLVAGGFLGGPTANRLINKFNLSTRKDQLKTVDNAQIEEAAITEERPLVAGNFSTATFELLIAMGIGTVISGLIEGTGITLPAYIGAMLAGVVIRNISDVTKKYDVPMTEIDILGGIALSLFLAMALMTLKLWELAELAIPMLIMVFAQVLLMFLFANFVTFKILGKDYDAAVLAAGHCGFGLGATPNGVANMEAVTANYGPSPTAFFVLPLVGAMFIDFANSFIITFFMNIV